MTPSVFGLVPFKPRFHWAACFMGKLGLDLKHEGSTSATAELQNRKRHFSSPGHYFQATVEQMEWPAQKTKEPCWWSRWRKVKKDGKRKDATGFSALSKSASPVDVCVPSRVDKSNGLKLATCSVCNCTVAHSTNESAFRTTFTLAALWDFLLPVASSAPWFWDFPHASRSYSDSYNA